VYAALAAVVRVRDKKGSGVVIIYTMGGSSMYVQKSISRVCSRMQV
jgi:hypothetical protein